MPFSAIINFRFSAGYVTDSAGQTCCANDPFPTSRGGLNFGWYSGSVYGEDRSTATGFVPEFAGINFTDDGTGPATFQLDLPAPGTYAVRLALGDAFAQSGMTCVLLDGPGGAVLATPISGASVGAGQYHDAAGVLRTSPAAWRSGNLPATVTVTGSALVVKLGNSPGAGGFTTLAHLEVADATGGGGGGSAPPGLLHFGRPLITRVY